MSQDIQTKEQFDAAVNALIEQYRRMCFWYSPRTYLPSTDQQRLKSLGNIERYGDRNGFIHARELRDWLSHHTNKN